MDEAGNDLLSGLEPQAKSIIHFEAKHMQCYGSPQKPGRLEMPTHNTPGQTSMNGIDMPDAGSASKSNSEIARRLYREAPLVPRLLLRWRPYICPFEALMAHVQTGSRVLDIGCGGGLFLGLLTQTRRGIHGYGVDSSASAIAVARGMARTIIRDRSDSALEFAVADAVAQLPKSSFDIVSLIDVVHHLEHDAVVPLLEAAAERVKRHGGLLIYKDLAPRPLWKATANRIHDLLIAKQWVYYFPVAIVEDSLCQCGLKIVHSETLDRLWYRHELRVFCRS